MPKTNVLFLCTGNSCRSIIAEALLRARGGDRFEAYSAGVQPKGIHPLTVQVLSEIGIDTRGLRSKDVAEYVGTLWVHYLVVVCHNAQESCPRGFHGRVERLFWELDDPPAFQGTDDERLNKFREVRDEIDRCVQGWIAQLSGSREFETIAGGHTG